MIKAAAYCRVSTDHKDQANSFESQQRYFKEYIDRQPNWELYQVYADEGITGTSTKKRAAFNQMIADAHQGKFQIILTKEVSRKIEIGISHVCNPMTVHFLEFQFFFDISSPTVAISK